MWQDGALGLKTYLKMQKVSDADEAGEDAAAWKMGVMPYVQLNYPELAAKLQALQQPQQPGAQPGQPQPAGQPEAGEPPNMGGEPPNASLGQVPLPSNGMPA
jgi:hypothetical protein